MALYLKYRPMQLSEMLGNEDLVNTLSALLENAEQRPHSYLLHGPTGCGKTTIARIIAKSVGGRGNDIREVDSADFRGIDTVREIRRQAQFSAMEGSCRVWIVDECHKMTGDAQSALLKILEDTPSHVYFILCTTDPQKLLPTIRGRCSQFQVKPLNNDRMFALLRRIVRVEDQTLTKIVYDQIIQDSFGLPRNALQILDQVLRVEPEKQLEAARGSAEKQSQSIELCRALINGSGWKRVAEILSGLKDQEAEGIRRHVLAYCQSVLLKSENDKAGLVMECFVEPFFNSGFPGLVFASYSVCSEGKSKF